MSDLYNTGSNVLSCSAVLTGIVPSDSVNLLLPLKTRCGSHIISPYIRKKAGPDEKHNGGIKLADFKGINKHPQFYIIEISVKHKNKIDITYRPMAAREI